MVRCLWFFKTWSVYLWRKTTQIFIGFNHISMLSKLRYLWLTILTRFVIWRIRQTIKHKTESHAQTTQKLIWLHQSSKINETHSWVCNGPIDGTRLQYWRLSLLIILRLLWSICLHSISRNRKSSLSFGCCIYCCHYH